MIKHAVHHQGSYSVFEYIRSSLLKTGSDIEALLSFLLTIKMNRMNNHKRIGDQFP